MTDEPCACALSQGSSETREECRERVLAVAEEEIQRWAGTLDRLAEK